MASKVYTTCNKNIPFKEVYQKSLAKKRQKKYFLKTSEDHKPENIFLECSYSNGMVEFVKKNVKWYNKYVKQLKKMYIIVDL